MRWLHGSSGDAGAVTNDRQTSLGRARQSRYSRPPMSRRHRHTDLRTHWETEVWPSHVDVLSKAFDFVLLAFSGRLGMTVAASCTAGASSRGHRTASAVGAGWGLGRQGRVGDVGVSTTRTPPLTRPALGRSAEVRATDPQRGGR